MSESFSRSNEEITEIQIVKDISWNDLIDEIIYRLGSTAQTGVVRVDQGKKRSSNVAIGSILKHSIQNNGVMFILGADGKQERKTAKALIQSMMQEIKELDKGMKELLPSLKSTLQSALTAMVSTVITEQIVPMQAKLAKLDEGENREIEIQLSVERIKKYLKDELEPQLKTLAQDQSKTVGDLANGLQNLKETFESKSTQMLQYAELTYQYVIKVYKQGQKNSTLLEALFGKIDRNGNVEAPGIFSKTMEVSMKRQEEGFMVLSQQISDLKQSFAGFDQRDIAVMVAWIEDQKKKPAKDIKKATDEYEEKLGYQLSKIEENLTKNSDDIIKKCNQIFDMEAESLEIGVTLLKMVKEFRGDFCEFLKKEYDPASKYEKFLKYVTEYVMQRILPEIGKAMEENISRYSGENSKASIEQQRAKEEELKNAKEMLQILQKNGKKEAAQCPYCGHKTERMIVGGECRCEICGHWFSYLKDTEAERRDRSEETRKSLAAKRAHDKSEGKKWRDLHTAKIEAVQEGGYYRVKLDPYCVSSRGILRIPPQADLSPSLKRKMGSNQELITIQEIVFCAPNTDDVFSRKEWEKVRTLFLPAGASIEGNSAKPGENTAADKQEEKVVQNRGKIPFSDMPLERVMRYNENNEATDDGKTLETIKKQK